MMTEQTIKAADNLVDAVSLYLEGRADQDELRKYAIAYCQEREKEMGGFVNAVVERTAGVDYAKQLRDQSISNVPVAEYMTPKGKAYVYADGSTRLAVEE